MIAISRLRIDPHTSRSHETAEVADDAAGYAEDKRGGGKLLGSSEKGRR